MNHSDYTSEFIPIDIPKTNPFKNNTIFSLNRTKSVSNLTEYQEPSKSCADDYPLGEVQSILLLENFLAARTPVEPHRPLKLSKDSAQRSFLAARRSFGIFLQIARLFKCLPESDLTRLEQEAESAGVTTAALDCFRKTIELSLPPSLLKQAELYCSWWKTAHSTSGVDVFNNLIEDMRRAVQSLCGSEQYQYQKIYDSQHQTTYIIPKPYSHEKVIVGSFVHSSILPGFKYKVRTISPPRYLFDGRALYLQSIGTGLGKQITFEGESELTPCVFSSDQSQNGYAFSIEALSAGEELVLLNMTLQVVATMKVTYVDEAQLEKTSKSCSQSEIVVLSSDLELVQNCDFIRKDVKIRAVCQLVLTSAQNVKTNSHHSVIPDITFSGSAILIKKPHEKHQQLLGLTSVKFYHDHFKFLDYLACVSKTLWDSQPTE
eukprot:Sdes_comp22878_c0_seq1m21251